MLADGMLQLTLQGLGESLYMTLLSTLCSYIIGLPLGLILVITDKNGIRPNAPVYQILGAIVNILRSVPFLILLVAVVPFTRLITGTSIGSTATVVPLVIAAAPFVARVVESSIKEVDRGVIEASLSMGASPMQVVRKVLVPEAMPSLLTGLALSLTTILSYSAMAGFVAGGGLGAIAINYGYYRQETDVMLLMVIILVIIVQVFQGLGNWIARHADKRIR